MIFLFIMPGIPSSLGNFIMPLQIGARDVAFPKINILSWWLFILGGAIAVTSLFTGGGPPDTGWTFYVPYSIRTGTNISLAVFGVFLIGMSSTLTGMNFLATIHRMRAPGLDWKRLPLFTWAIYATSWVQLLATPVLAITLLLIIMERFFGVGFFDPAKGGDPILFEHMFWIYSHPAVYIMIIPAMGVVSDIIPVFSRRNIYGYAAIAASSLAIAFVGYLVWGHHMFTSGMSDTARIVFSFLTFIVAVPSGIKVFNWIATFYKGSISMDAPLLYVLGFHLPLFHRRADRPDPGRAGHEPPCPRHLLHRGALPLRDVRRRRLRVLRRAPLLVSEDVRKDATAKASRRSPGSSCSSASTCSTSPCSCSAGRACRGGTTITCLYSTRRT